VRKVLISTVIVIIIIALSLTGCIKKEAFPEIVEPTTTEKTDTADSLKEMEDTPETDQETPDIRQEERIAPAIVFMSSSGSVSKICICNPDGTDLQKLIEGGIFTAPSWNREHSKIIFTSINPENGASSLHIFDNKSKSITILLERFSPIDPSFDPEGKKVVFADFPEEDTENLEIYTIDIDGSNLSRLTDNPARDYFPKYSPDGKRVVFSSERDGNIQLYTMDSSGENAKRLIEDDYFNNHGSFSPDGLNIVFQSNRGGNFDLYKINSDGRGEIQNITKNSADNFDACYSPDGSRIVYRSNKGSDDSMSYDIFVMAASGSNQINITPDLKNTNEFSPSW
jgi:Tol biopolymer transport system component